MYEKIITKSKKPYLQSLKDDIKARRDPNFFWPTGTQVYTGKQGSGKTISAVYHLLKLKQRYPLAWIVSNLDLKTYRGIKPQSETHLQQIINKGDPSKHYISYSTVEELHLVLTKVNNDKFGVIYIIDEIHTYFNALNSKNTPMFVFTEISQQRKQRKLIIGTSQIFLRMEKALREQCDNLIVCRTIMGIWTFQKAYDGMTLDQDYDGTLKGNLKKSGWFFHNRNIRNAFDTYQKVVSSEVQYEQLMKPLKLESNKKFKLKTK